MHPPLAGQMIVTQLFGSLRGGPQEAYDVVHDGVPYRARGHCGIDFNAAMGTPVMAMKGGVARYYGPAWGYPDLGYAPLGLLAVVTLPTGEQQWYGHLSEAIAANGATVAEGQQIAVSGASGSVTGPHLHVGWRPAHINYNNGFDAFADFMTNFYKEVYPLIDLTLV